MSIELVRRVEALEQLLDGAAARMDPAARELQIARLEKGLVHLERRVRALDPSLHPSLDIFDVERAELSARADAVRAKIAWLNEGGAQAAREGRPPPGTEHALWDALHRLVLVLQTDPDVPVEHVEHWKRRLVERVRARRARLREVVAELERVQHLLLEARTPLQRLIDLSWAIPADPTVDARTLLRDRRSEAAAQLENARIVFADARRAFAWHADQWPELRPIAALPDWTRIPLFGARQQVMPVTDSGSVWTVAHLQERLGQAREMTTAIVLWIEELAEKVRTAPPPSEGGVAADHTSAG
jgi:hypothetical protein